MDAYPRWYTHAVVSRVPLALRTRGEIELDEARRQHECFTRLLRELGLDVLEMAADETLPDGVFVEDIAVICNGMALMTKPKAQRRQKEVDWVRAVLKKEMGLPVIEIQDKDARLEGGDVLFTGREFFVGISEWSNEAGARAVAATFPEYPCTPVKVNDVATGAPVTAPPAALTARDLHLHQQVSASTKHLKAYLSMAGPDVLCVGASKESQEILKRIEREATFSYQTLTVPEEDAANCLYVNGTLIHRAIEEIPESFKVFCEKIDFARRSVCFSELAKLSSGLTSCCLLVNSSKLIKHI